MKLLEKKVCLQKTNCHNSMFIDPSCSALCGPKYQAHLLFPETFLHSLFPSLPYSPAHPLAVTSLLSITIDYISFFSVLCPFSQCHVLLTTTVEALAQFLLVAPLSTPVSFSSFESEVHHQNLMKCAFSCVPPLFFLPSLLPAPSTYACFSAHVLGRSRA